MRRILLFMLSMLLISSQLLAQNRTITGKVTDDKGNPVPNASVTVRGSKTGTVTSQDGTFSIVVPANVKTIVVSSVGLDAKEVVVSADNSYSIALTSSANDLQEVVVVGYGTKSVREVTGAISKIDGAKIANEPVSSFNQALAGKTAGVQVNLSTGLLADRTAIRIRGINSISGSSQPLIVIDGIPSFSGNLNGFNSGNGTRFDPLSLVNSNDIESIEVLKDAGAAAIYGSRASNGVILITTKKGKKGTMQVSFDSKASWAQASKLPELLNGDDFITISNEKTTNRFGAASPYATPAKNSDVNGDGVNDHTNWNDLLYRTGLMTDNTVSFRGGADKMTVFGSLRYLNQEGITLANKLRSGQARLNLEITPKTWFKGGLQMAYTKSLNNGVLTDTYISGTTVSGWMAPPTVSPYNPAHITGFNLTPAGLLSLGNNTPVAPGGGTLLPGASYYYNTLAGLKLNRNDNTAQDTRVNIYGELSPIKGLKLTSRFGVVYLTNFEDQYTAPYIAGLGVPYNGLVQNQQQNNNSWNFQNYASYDRVIASKHKISVTAGTEYQKRKYNYYYVGAGNFSDPFFKEIIDGAYTNTQPGSTTILDFTGGDNTSNGFISYFGRASYSFNGKYFVEGAFRRDGYSAFGKNNQFGSFPGVSIGWEATRENFMSGITWLNYLKVRGGYGKTGNSQGLTAYASRTLYSGAAYTSLTGLGISQAGNPNLQWESANKINAGFDATVLNNKVSLTVDYFKNDINNLILAAPTLYTVGIPRSSISTNIGGMTNKGIEFTVNATPVSNRKFTWSTSFNYTNIKNTITGLVPSNNNADITGGNQVASIGKALGTYKLPKWAGVDPATGNPMWYSASGDIKMWDFASQTWKDDKGNASSQVTAADYVYLDKTGLPTWYGGWDNTFTYGQFDLNVAISFQGGNYIYNSTKSGMLTNFFSNNFAEIKNRWTASGQVTDIPKLWASDNTAQISSTRFLEKGDYARVRTITLGYNISKDLLRRAGFERMRFYVQAFNPFTITKYSGLDPDVNYNSFDNIAVGTDNRATPQVKTITVGLNVTF